MPRDTKDTVVLEKRIAKITEAILGCEYHDIFALDLRFDYGDSCQGLGGMCLDTPLKRDGEFERRAGTAIGMELIMRTVKACGVERWDQIVGRTVYVLKEEGWNGLIRGIEPLPTEPGERLVFSEVFDA